MNSLPQNTQLASILWHRAIQEHGRAKLGVAVHSVHDGLQIKTRRCDCTGKQ